MKTVDEINCECYKLCHVLSESEKREIPIEVKENIFMYATGALCSLIWLYNSAEPGPSKAISDYFKVKI